MTIFSVPAMLEQTAARLPEKQAIIQESQGITFAALRERAINTSHVLRDLGVRRGDRVAVCMDKSIDQAVVLLGIMYANAILVPVLPRLKHDNIAHIIRDSGARLIVSDLPRLKEVEAFSAEAQVVLGVRAAHSILSVPSTADRISQADPFIGFISEDAAGIIYSSGSTGRPKGIVTSHRNFHDGAHIVAKYLGTREEERIAAVLSFNFDYGLNQLWQCIHKGASLYLHDVLLPNDVYAFIDRWRITALPLMPVIITRMFDPRLYAPEPGLDLSCVRYICSSGGRVSNDMIASLKGTFSKAEIFLMYGLTEAFRSTFLPPGQMEIRQGSIGKAIPEAEIYVLDEEYRDCPPGVPGELVHRGGCISKGYWNDAKSTAVRFRQIDRFPGERVVFSGDLVKTDEDGYLYFISRRDNMLKNSGIRISPTEVEETVERYDDVASVVVFGIENIEVGHDIVLVYTTTSRSPLDDAEFTRFMKRELPPHMVPKYLVHLPEFPTTGNEGKIDRVAVASRAKVQLGVSSEPSR
jgi:acyl-CoA synthetase (AMP-forming)/AMP-acid ligase II